MGKSIFERKAPELTLENYVQLDAPGRENLGNMLPVFVYRLFQYTIKDELIKAYGEDRTIEIYRNAGYQAGQFFAHHLLDLTLPFNEFVEQLTSKLEEYKIGVLRVEKFEEDTGRAVLTVAEDADCSGLPMLGKTVCNYDEGFISAILSTYTGKNYTAIEIDCWATGDRVCRFNATVDA